MEAGACLSLQPIHVSTCAPCITVACMYALAAVVVILASSPPPLAAQASCAASQACKAGLNQYHRPSNSYSSDVPPVHNEVNSAGGGGKNVASRSQSRSRTRLIVFGRRVPPPCLHETTPCWCGRAHAYAHLTVPLHCVYAIACMRCRSAGVHPF